MRTKAQKSSYDQGYIKQHVKRLLLAFNELNPVDVEILGWLNTPGLNKTEYIKSLILKDMRQDRPG